VVDNAYPRAFIGDTGGPRLASLVDMMMLCPGELERITGGLPEATMTRRDCTPPPPAPGSDPVPTFGTVSFKEFYDSRITAAITPPPVVRPRRPSMMAAPERSVCGRQP
jgi:hypothetical protein